MDVEVIPNTDIYLKDIEDIRLIKKKNVSYYYVTLKNNGGRCTNCGRYITRVYNYKRKKIIHDHNIIIIYKSRRYRCDCGKTFYEYNPFSNRKDMCSDNLIKNVLIYLKRYNHTFLETAKVFNISVTKVIDIFDTHVQIKRKTLREVISIDEFYFSRHSRNKYAFLILGLNGEILDIVESRKKLVLLDYFKYIPLEERKRVKYVTMDMNDIYRNIIKRRIPNAIISIDSFHVMKLINDALERVRLKVMRRYEDNKIRDEYYLLKHKKYVLFVDDLDIEYKYSYHFKIKMNDEDYLTMILRIDKELSDTYQMVKRYYYLNHYWNEYSKEEAYAYIKRYIDECYLSGYTSLINIANTLTNWIDEISNSFIPYIKRNKEIIRLSNGRIEGKNSYIKKMLYLANGYHNFKRFRNRVMYSQNLYETYSVNELPNTIKRRYKKIDAR